LKTASIEIVHIECECALALLNENQIKKLAELQLMLNLFSAGKFKLKKKIFEKVVTFILDIVKHFMNSRLF